MVFIFVFWNQPLHNLGVLKMITLTKSENAILSGNLWMLLSFVGMLSVTLMYPSMGTGLVSFGLFCLGAAHHLKYAAPIYKKIEYYKGKK